MPAENQFFTATGAGAIAETLAPTGGPWELVEIRLHMSAAGSANDFTTTLDAAAGAAYADLVHTEDMTALTDVRQTFCPPVPFQEGDELGFAYVNSTSKTWGLTAVYRDSGQHI